MLSSLPSGPHTVVCAVETPGSLEQDSRERRRGSSWWISAAAQHHAQHSPPPVQGRPVGRPRQAGVREARRGASLEWKELPARISVFHIGYCQRPISPARGPCQCDKRAADDSCFGERQNSPLPPQKFGKIGILPSTRLLIIPACY